MNIDRYQELADKTSLGKDQHNLDRLLCATLGLVGEAGELANKVKKWTYHGHPSSIMGDRIREEIGDCLWYLAELCSALQWPMGKIAEENLSKLAGRYPDGFTVEDSVNREPGRP
jgi:NTP pyrophosphatase (non-canonical NTP hydrolase)